MAIVLEGLTGADGQRTREFRRWSFRAFWVEKTEDQAVRPEHRRHGKWTTLPEGELLIDVAWSVAQLQGRALGDREPGRDAQFSRIPPASMPPARLIESASPDFLAG